MTNLLLCDPNEQPLELDVLDRIFAPVEGFRDVRHNTPVGTPIEARYEREDDFTIVRLNSKRKAISIAGTSDISFHAALTVQKHFSIPLRIVDTNYSFDLMLSDFDNFEELRAAVKIAQAK